MLPIHANFTQKDFISDAIMNRPTSNMQLFIYFSNEHMHNSTILISIVFNHKKFFWSFSMKFFECMPCEDVISITQNVHGRTVSKFQTEQDAGTLGHHQLDNMINICEYHTLNYHQGKKSETNTMLVLVHSSLAVNFVIWY